MKYLKHLMYPARVFVAAGYVFFSFLWRSTKKAHLQQHCNICGSPRTIYVIGQGLVRRADEVDGAASMTEHGFTCTVCKSPAQYEIETYTGAIYYVCAHHHLNPEIADKADATTRVIYDNHSTPERIRMLACKDDVRTPDDAQELYVCSEHHLFPRGYHSSVGTKNAETVAVLHQRNMHKWTTIGVTYNPSALF